ncbi:MAG: hypothetical protein MH219_04310 [Marinobacter sp.]|nr:hypothetical protein [Marinobacter sp.]
MTQHWKALEAAGAAVLTAEEKSQPESVMWQEGSLNRQVIAKPAPTIVNAASLTRDGLSAARFLIVEETGIGSEYPFSGEKLSPVLAVYRAKNFDDAFKITQQLLEHQGKGLLVWHPYQGRCQRSPAGLRDASLPRDRKPGALFRDRR